MSPEAPRTASAVLVPTYLADAARGRSHVLVLVRRAEGGVHGSQLAFPGGKRDPDDASPLETALREANEEIGLARGAVLTTEALPIVDTFTTRYRIRPFLARIRRPDGWRLDPREVAEVIEVPVHELVGAEVRGRMWVKSPGYPEGAFFPYIRVGPHRLWGVTYRILEPLLPRLLAGDAEGA